VGARIGFLFPGQGSQNTTAATEIALPAIVRDSLRALTEDATLRIAAERGRLMSEIRGIPGAMAALGAGEEQTLDLIEGEAVVIGRLNSPRQTVVSGESDAVRRVVERAKIAMAIQARLADRAAEGKALPEPAVAVAQ
jgi:acyl transferase domain-containing protein